MKIKKLIERLNKLNPNMDIIGFDPFEEKLTKVININAIQHNGKEFNCYNAGMEIDSNIPSGSYLLINFGD